MKDIDFDELDRAVSSVLGQKTSSDDPTTTTATAEDTTDVQVNIQSESSTSDSQVTEPVPDPVPVAQDTPKPSLAVKRRGKFMDMVHPSAAMTAKPSTSQPLTSHAAPVVQPVDLKLEPDTAPDVLEQADSLKIESTVEHKAEPTAVVDESQTLIGAEPTSLDDGSHTLPATTPDLPSDDTDITKSSDVLGATSDSEDETKSIVLPAEESQNETIAASTDESSDTAASSFASTVSSTTPFLADAKVEKRPLGGAVEGETATEAPAASDSVDNQNPPVVPLPRELQPDVMEVESDKSASPVDATSETSTPGFATSVEAAPDPGEDGRVEGHPLFDTSTYHEPITPVPHKSIPAWLKWILGLTVCLIIGAGVGYFIFTAGL